MTEHIYMPNEIFNELHPIGSSKQIAFAYSYYYYITYLYRYCRYISGNEKITQDQIKEKLGYSPTNKKINHIIKKGGILDTIGYTETTTDYPIHYLYEENMIEFYTLSDYKKEIGVVVNDKNYKIKKPLKSFFRNKDSDYNDGTFYDVSNTHKINHEVFETCMNTELKSMGFYIYGYLKHQIDMFENYQKSYHKIADALSITKKTVIKYMDELEKNGLIHIQRMIFHPQMKEEDRESNIYKMAK